MTQIRVFKDLHHLARHTAELFVSSAMRAIKEKGVFNVVLAGGNASAGAYQYLSSDLFVEKVPWKNTHLFWGDERYVPQNHKESNYKLVKEFLLDLIPVPKNNVHPFKTDSPPEKAAYDYEKILIKHFNLPPEMFPKFDLVLVNMNDDGHTDALLQHSGTLGEKNKLAVAYYFKNMNSFRLTLTASVFTVAETAVFLVADSKLKTLKSVLQGIHFQLEWPARLLQADKCKYSWLVDRTAVELIKPDTGYYWVEHHSPDFIAAA